MKVPVLNKPRISSKIAPTEYSRAGDAFPRVSGFTAGLDLAARIAAKAGADAEQLEARNKTERDQERRFRASAKFTEFEGATKLRQQELRAGTQDDQTNVADYLNSDFEAEAHKFQSQLDPEDQIEMAPRLEALRQNTRLDSSTFEFNNRTRYYTKELDKLHEQSKVLLGQDPSFTTLVTQQAKLFDAVDRSGLAPIDKEAKKEIISRELQTIVYSVQVKKNGTLGPGTGKVEAGSVADTVLKGARDMGGDDQLALDLLTLISYETAGTFSPGIVGGKDNLYQGIIQFGPAERAKYGVTGKETFEEQFKQAMAFLKDRGYKPGMGLLDLYSIVNAGSPGRYDASDGPGQTVRTHVNDMLNSGHRQKALALLKGDIDVGALDKNSLFQNVSYEDRNAAIADGLRAASDENQARQKQREDDYSQSYNQLLMGLNDGKVGQIELENFREQNPGMSYEELNKAQNIIAERNKAGQTLLDAQALLRTGMVWDPTDPDHKKYSDALVGPVGLVALNNSDEAYVKNTLSPLVERIGMVPPTVAGTLQGMLRSVNPQQNKYALDALGQLRDQYPRAFDALPEKLNKDLDLWDTARGYMNEGELLNLIRGAPTAEQRQAQNSLREDARHKLQVPTDPEYVNFDQVIGSYSNWGSVFSGKADVRGYADAKAIMRSEFNGLFEYEYTIDGNAEAATERAIRQLNRVWGVTSTGGIKHIMKYPPESQYRPVMGSHDYITEQVRVEANIAPDESFALVGDAQTAQEVQRNRYMAGGQGDRANRPEIPFEPASYQIVRIKNGLPQAVMKDGKPYRIFFVIPEKLKQQELAVFNYEQQKKVDDLYYNEVTDMFGKRGMSAMTKEIRDELERRKQRLQGLKDTADSYSSTYQGDQPPVY